MSTFENHSQLCRDDTFGPAVPDIAVCRGGFDFTGIDESQRDLGSNMLTVLSLVTFEESIFSILPSCLLFFLFSWRLFSLHGRTLKTRKSYLYKIKLVR